jgi:ribosomal protein S18 acetylase RimI-like enzyme
MSIEIRRITPHDTALFQQIAEDVFDEPIVPERLAAYLKNPANLMVLAVINGEVVGQVAAVLLHHPDKPTGLYIDEVGVSPRFQRQGIAKQMMQEMLVWGRELGCEDVWLGTEPENAPAQALYAKFAEAEPIVIYQWDL